MVNTNNYNNYTHPTLHSLSHPSNRMGDVEINAYT